MTLDGSKSNDKDGKIESYHWQQISGPKVDLENTNKSKANFVSPSVNHDTILVFKLIVTDDKGRFRFCNCRNKSGGRGTSQLNQPRAKKQSWINLP